MIRRLAALSTIVVLACACSKTTSDEEVLTGLVDTTIVASYQSAASAASQLVSQIQTGCADRPEPGGSRREMRSGPEGGPSEIATTPGEAVAKFRQAWAKTEATWFGPAQDHNASSVHALIDTAAIDRLLADSSVALDAAAIAQRPQAERGLLAVEYLLATGNLSEPRRCAYATSAARVIQGTTKAIADRWATSVDGKPAYRETFLDNTDGSIKNLVDTNVGLVHKMAEEIEIGLGGNVDQLLEGPNGNGVAYQRERLSGLRAVYAEEMPSDVEHGLSRRLDGDLAADLKKAFDEADAALNSLNGPIRKAVVDDRADAEKATASLDTLAELQNDKVVKDLGIKRVK